MRPTVLGSVIIEINAVSRPTETELDDIQGMGEKTTK
jgi:hypothetical protein